MSAPLRILLIFVAVGLCVGVGWYLLTPSGEPSPGDSGIAVKIEPPPPDPRETFATPFRNVRPGVKYVGDAACAGCHADITASYHQHPMGRSAVVGTTAALEKFAPENKPTFTAQGFTLTATPTKHTVAFDGLPPYTVTADIALGSGTRGRSYLTLDRGAAWQSPVSWFSRDARWDISPGFDLHGNGGRRAVNGDCLFCHVDRVVPVPGSTNRFAEPFLPGQAAVGCERCHGPGELHVRERADGPVTGIDHSIVNPKHLAIDLHLDICRQCHLQGAMTINRRGRDPFEFRPGLPLDQFRTTFVRHPDLSDAATKSVGQFEQMAASKCATSGKLTCVSCHDPHAKPADAATHYRAKCLTCHDTRGCSLPLPERQTKQDHCTKCHMPRGNSSNIAHTSIIDHSVPRRPSTVAPRKRPDRDTLPMLAYPPGPHAPPAADRERDLGIALSRYAANLPIGPDGMKSIIGLMAEPRLQGAVKDHPGDGEAWLALAGVSLGRQDAPAAATFAQNAVTVAPQLETAKLLLAESLGAGNRLPEALAVYDELVATNPTAVGYRLSRSEAKVWAGDWIGAEADARAVLAIHPMIAQAHLLLAVCRAKQRDMTSANQELDFAVRLAGKPEVAKSYKEWFARQVR